MLSKELKFVFVNCCYFSFHNLYIKDNGPIHASQSITSLIELRDYRAISFPPYSPELNPIENLWLVIKNSMERSVFRETEDSKTRINEVGESISRKTPNITQHSVNNFQTYLNKEPL